MMSKRVFLSLSAWDSEGDNDMLFHFNITVAYSIEAVLKIMFELIIHKASRNLVPNYTPFGLSQLKKELPSG